MVERGWAGKDEIELRDEAEDLLAECAALYTHICTAAIIQESV